MTEMLLLPRPVPQPLWGRNLRLSMGDAWLAHVSRPIRNEARVCELCGSAGADSPTGWPICCDEVWNYDEADELVEHFEMFGALPPKYEAPTARLVDLQAVCWRCNCIIHMGYTETTTPDLLREAVEHALGVNKAALPAFTYAVSSISRRWEIHSLIEDWRITWANWNALLAAKMAKLRDPVRHGMTEF